jgi:hypothetical protein
MLPSPRGVQLPHQFNGVVTAMPADQAELPTILLLARIR